ncbi:MAG: sterol desaturase family protein [Myxococcota bacterium]
MEEPFRWLLLVLPVLVALEWLWSRRTGRDLYDPRETLATLGILLGSRVSRVLALPLSLALFEAVAPYALFELPTTPAVFLVALVLTDFVYYWHHRLSHEIPVLWAIHQTHHSAERLNLLASARLSWLGPWIVQPVLALPLVLLGFPPVFVVGVAAVDLVFQFFLHTEAIGRLPWVEGWLNTPAAHRIHHARDEDCLDRCYAGIFVVWDRMFGTFVDLDRADRPLSYGLTSGPQGHNPVWLVFGGFVRWARGEPV